MVIIHRLSPSAPSEYGLSKASIDEVELDRARTASIAPYDLGNATQDVHNVPFAGKIVRRDPISTLAGTMEGSALLLWSGETAAHEANRRFVSFRYEAVGGSLVQGTTAVPPEHSGKSWDVTNRIEEIKSLEAGWYDEDSESLDPDALDVFAGKFALWYPPTAERPYIFPTPDGALRAEWRLGAKEVSLEIDLSDFSAYWHWIDLTTDVVDDGEMDLNIDDHWRWIGQEIQRLGNQAA